jgi:hypothetical protein
MSAAAPSLSQRAFAQALLDPQQPCPPGLRSWNGSDPAARFAVHRNNAVSSLVAALADTFPVTRELVGEAFFAAMARLFVMGAPPRSPVLALYGGDFPAFVESFAPARPVPYLADVARLEVQRVRAFHAADAPVLSAGDLTGHLRDPEALPASRVEFQPSAAVLTSRFAIVALWAAHQDAGEIAEVDPGQPQSALVLRQQEDVAVIAIAQGGALFFQRLMAGATLGEASAAAMACADGFDLAASLGILICHGALSAWHRGPGSPSP